ncbi:YihY/virulence factor BrkB family protein [Allohahella marinimesophila]|uniref:YihY family inner membrane protein n=1 Tax=Allohahella marinimesophila TaxID=1054972 RepID=A0ABP7PVX9_9GAMM
MTSSGHYLHFSLSDWASVGRSSLKLCRQCRISDFAYSAAFNAFLALFPATLAILTFYGLFTDSSTVEQQVTAISKFLPATVSNLAEDRLTSLASTPRGNLGWGLAVSIFFACAVIFRGTSTLLSTLSAIHAQHLDGAVQAGIGRTIVASIFAVLFIVLCLSILIIVPAIVQFLPALVEDINQVRLIVWPGLFIVICVALGVLYRYSRTTISEKPSLFSHWLSPGAVSAALIWLIGSGLFSFYVSRFGQYDVVFGSLSAIAVLMIWLYLTNFIILLGAVLNTAIGDIGKSRS